MDYSTLNRRELLVQVAKMYYIKGMSQEEIAKEIRLSRSNISRMIKTCIDEKIVEFRINELSSVGIELQKKIKELFGLSEVIIVPTDANSEMTKSSAGAAAASYLESVLRDGMLVGIAWGSTLYYTVQHFKPVKSICADVIQMVGGTGSKSISTDGQELAKNLARILNGESYIIQAPLMVKSKVLKDLLMEEPQIKQHFNLMKKLDVALVGIGSSRPDLSAIYKSGCITKEESEELYANGAKCDICASQIDAKGNVISELSERIVGIDVAQLKSVPLVIGVASGVEKTDAILAGLRGKYVNALIVDEATALSVLSAERN